MPSYYVYILFDWQGIPRYVGKGKGDRWLAHEQHSDLHNPLKNEFIERTWIMLGEIPKIKVAEQITELESFIIETALIQAIGRINRGTGSLTNLTDGGEGVRNRVLSQFSLELMSLSAYEREARFSPQTRMILNQLISVGVMKNTTADERSARARYAASHISKEDKIARLNGGTTFEDRSARLKAAFGRMPLERRIARSKAGGDALAAVLTPEEHREWGRRLSKTYLENTTPEQRSDKMRRAWVIRRSNGNASTNVGSRWINNGSIRRRLPAGEKLPEGWEFGKLQTKRPVS